MRGQRRCDSSCRIQTLPFDSRLQNESLKRELDAALMDRDRAVRKESEKNSAPDRTCKSDCKFDGDLGLPAGSVPSSDGGRPSSGSWNTSAGANPTTATHMNRLA